MSPTVKYDVSGIEPTGSDVVPAGTYEAAITDCQYGESKSGNEMFTIELTIKGGTYDSRKLWHYVLPGVPGAEFRMREFIDALGLPDKGGIDPAKVKGTVVQIRTKVENSADYGEQARIKNLMPGGGAVADEDEAPYTEWEQSELKDEIEAREIEIEGRMTKAKMVAALEADDAAVEGEGEDDDEDEEEDDEGTEPEEDEGDDTDEEEEDEEDDEEEGMDAAEVRMLSRTDLKALIKEQELSVRVTKSKSDEALAEEVIAALELGDDEEDEEEEDDDEVDYESWTISDLKTELKERSLKPEGKKSLLIKRLRDNDASAEPF